MSTSGAIVGFVIDVSRSMKHGMRDQFTSEGTRIDSVLSALERAAHAMGARTFSPAGSRADEVLVFAYVFGFTRSRDQVCDLFSLLAALGGSQRRSISPARAVLDDPRARLWSIAVENGRA